MARLLVLMACAGPVAGFHEHIVHHVGGLFGGGGSYEEGHVPEPRYLYDELGNVIPFDPKDQHGEPCPPTPAIGARGPTGSVAGAGTPLGAWLRRCVSGGQEPCSRPRLCGGGGGLRRHPALYALACAQARTATTSANRPAPATSAAPAAPAARTAMKASAARPKATPAVPRPSAAPPTQTWTTLACPSPSTFVSTAPSTERRESTPPTATPPYSMPSSRTTW
mmetsp:Transcript_32224/g.104064  ORF Transcript_32224/g.104064 Transcript_32224/m.104064 type:complete len:223 (-) Transcript_32224:455-1123(-)